MLHLLLKMDKIAMLASLIVICVSQSTRWGICGKLTPDIDKIKNNEKCKKATISDAIITTTCCLCCWFSSLLLAGMRKIKARLPKGCNPSLSQ